MANRYANLVGSNKIKDEYTKINQGFDKVQQDMDAKPDRSIAQVNNVQMGTDDTLTIEGSTGITVTTNPSQKKVTITATGTSTPGPHGPSHNNDGADPIPDLQNLTNEFDAHKADFAGFMAAASGLNNNALINGNFDFWQRGASFTINTTGVTYCADRWKVQNNSANTLNVTRQQFVPGHATPAGARYFMRIVRTGTTSAELNLAQRIEDVRTFAGQKITVSFYAKSDAVRNITLIGVQEFGVGGSPAVTFGSTNYNVTGTWQRFTFTMDVPDITGKTIGQNSFLEIRIARSVDNGSVAYTLDIAQAQINLGDTVLPFQPRHPALELLLCQRYYTKSYNLDEQPGKPGQTNRLDWTAITATRLGASKTYQYPVTMRVNPTVTIYSTETGAAGKMYNANSSTDIDVTIDNIGQHTTTFLPANAVDISAGDRLLAQITADAEL